MCIDIAKAENEAKQTEAAARIKKLETDMAKAKALKGRLFGTGGSTTRRYSFKKLQKRKRANKSNKAKRGKQLNRSKKMRR